MAAAAKAWRFHPTQAVEADGDELVVRFRSGGLREIAEHLFTWGGEVAIEAPDALRAVMRERLAAGAGGGATGFCRKASETEQFFEGLR